MKIACLGWGSLIWKPGILPVNGPWRRDGPDLPIDFARESDGGELATVICASAPRARVMWAMLKTGSMAAAREGLRRREQIPSSQPHCIGSVGNGIPDPRCPHAAAIAAWAAAQGLDGVVWTALPPRFQGINGVAPHRQAALHYLRQLPPDQRLHAEHYVRSTPLFVATQLRTALADDLGWRCTETAARLLALRQGAPNPGTSRRRYPVPR